MTSPSDFSIDPSEYTRPSDHRIGIQLNVTKFLYDSRKFDNVNATFSIELLILKNASQSSSKLEHHRKEQIHQSQPSNRRPYRVRPSRPPLSNLDTGEAANPRQTHNMDMVEDVQISKRIYASMNEPTYPKGTDEGIPPPFPYWLTFITFCQNQPSPPHQGPDWPPGLLRNILRVELDNPLPPEQPGGIGCFGQQNNLTDTYSLVGYVFFKQKLFAYTEGPELAKGEAS